MLIGMAITLLMMAAVVNLFANIGAGVRIRQATIELSSELRDVRTQLYNDLTHATCRTLPWQRPDEDPGYLEIVEGNFSDRNPSILTDGNPGNGELNYAISQIPGSQDPNVGDTTDGSGLGDYDDIVALTVRQETTPFRGRFIEENGMPNGNPKTIESSVAEVIWFAVENQLTNPPPDEPGMRKIYRRALIVAPWVDLTWFNNNFPPTVLGTGVLQRVTNYDQFYDQCDVSVHVEEVSANTYRWVANTLGDLTKRENRFAHYYNFDASLANGFPHQFPYDVFNTANPLHAGVANSSLQSFGLSRAGEDLLLENVLAFDVLVYDPGAPLFQEPTTGTIIEPISHDLFTTNASIGGVIDPTNLVSFGAHVDLGWDNSYDYNATDPNLVASYDSFYESSVGFSAPSFQEERQLLWRPVTPKMNRGLPAIYDTWSLHYEYDGLNQDPNQDTFVDEGTNGLDDDAANGVDDLGERETSPPYDEPLRGIQVKVRIYEPDTRQVREVSVTASYVPQ